MSAATRRSRATATTGGTSGPAHANTIRARKANAWADVARRVHRSNTTRSSSASSNGFSFGPRRGTDAPEAEEAEEVIRQLTTNYWRRTLAAHNGLDGRIHLALVAPALTVTALVASRWALDVREGPAADPETGESGAEEPPRFALPGKGVLAVGLIGLCAVFAEGASMDWSGIYLRDVTDADPGLAAAAFTAFACTMAVARLVGDAVVRRMGPVRTVRASGLLAALGCALVVAAETSPLAITGFALIGVGVAVVVPLCFAAAGRIKTSAPGQAIAGVATLAYASGLAAPAAVGWIAEATSLRFSFGLVTVLLLGLVFGAGVLRTQTTPPAATAGAGGVSAVSAPRAPEHDEAGRAAKAGETAD